MDSTTLTSDTLLLDELNAALVGAGFAVSPPATVRRTVFETFDGRVSSAGLRLETYEQHGLELILTGGGTAPARVSTDSAPRRADDLPVGPLRFRLGDTLGLRALLPTLTLTGRVSVATRRDHDAKARVRVSVHDQVTVEGRSPIGGIFVEVVPVAGYDNDGARADELLRGLGLRPAPGDLIDIAARASGVALTGFSTSPTVPLRREEPALDAFRRLLAHLADTVAATWQGTVDDLDPEFLHDLRVAVRRTRSVLAQGKGVLPRPVRRRFQEGFRWLGTATGRPRDLDVYLIEWDDYVSPLGPVVGAALGPVRDHLARQRDEAHRVLADVLRSARYRELMSGWGKWLTQPPTEQAEVDAQSPIGAVVARRTGNAQDLLLAHGRSIGPASPAEDLHELRKDAKKLRYLLECFGSLYPPAQRKAFVQLLKALQDNLGEHQDTEVHVSELRDLPPLLNDTPGVEPATLVAMGQLTEQLERRRRAARDDFAERFAAYDTKDTRRSFSKLLRSADSPR